MFCPKGQHKGLLLMFMDNPKPKKLIELLTVINNEQQSFTNFVCVVIIRIILMIPLDLLYGSIGFYY